ncbi:unnamed protein product [Laminaria digitata]
MPPSVGLLKDTLIAKVVAPLRKNTDQQIARLANDIVRRWKEAARAASAFEQHSKTDLLPVPPPPKGRTDHRGNRGGGCSNGTGNGAVNGPGNGAGNGMGNSGGGERSPAEEKQLKVERGFRCRDWHSLYQHLEMLKSDKVRASSKRAREAREREQQKRPKLIFGKSKGEDYTKNAARSSRNGAPAFSSASSSSSSSARGFFSPPSNRPSKNPAYGSSSSSKKNSKEEITSVSELRQSVVIGQRLSTPIIPGQRQGAAAAAAAAGRSAKRNKFWQ